MKVLAKIGFSQSYSYFTWRTHKAEFQEYLSEITRYPDAVRSAVFTSGPYYGPRTGLICVENTHNAGGGSIYPDGTLSAIRAIADEARIPLHMDGARVFHANRNVGHVRGECGDTHRRGFSAVRVRGAQRAVAGFAITVLSPTPKRTVLQARTGA